MQSRRWILAAVCILAVAFGGGAATYAHLSDTETASISAKAGVFDLCTAGETVTYEFSRRSGELEHVGGPDIVTFGNYDYRTFFGSPRAVDAVDFDSLEPIRRAEYRSRFGGTGTRTFDPPATQGRLDPPGFLFSGSFVEVTFTCAAGDGGGTRPASVSTPASSSGAVVESSEVTETPVPTTVNGTATPENTSANSTAATAVAEPTGTTPTATPPSTEAQTATTTETPTATEATNTTPTGATTETQAESRVANEPATGPTKTAETPEPPGPTETAPSTETATVPHLQR